MNWQGFLKRTSITLAVISLALALYGGVHLQHLVNDEGGRHAGEFIVLLALAILSLAASLYGSRQTTNS